MNLKSNVMLFFIPELPISLIAGASWIQGSVSLAKLLPLSELWSGAPSHKRCSRLKGSFTSVTTTLNLLDVA